MNTQSDWIPIPLEGMQGDPETVTGGALFCQILENAEIGIQRFRTRLGDHYDIRQPTTQAEQVYNLYWIPYPIEYPLLRAWTDGQLGSRGVFHVPSQSAGYFLLNRNYWLVVRFVGFLSSPTNLSTGVNIDIEATEPTEFYEWMTKGYLQISQKVGDEYRSEIAMYQDGSIDLKRQFRAKLVARGQLGTSAKAWTVSTSAPVRLYTVHILQNIEAPRIITVTDTEAVYAKLDSGIDPSMQTIRDSTTVSDKGANLHAWYNRPVLVAPTLISYTQNLREYAGYRGTEGIVSYEYHRLLSTNVGNRYAYGPRDDHNEPTSYRRVSSPTGTYPNFDEARSKNFLGNHWDAYLLSGDAYWRSLPNYLTNSYDSVCPKVIGSANSGPIPHIDFKTINAGKFYLCMRTMLNGDTERVRFLYRFLKNPTLSARDPSNYHLHDMRDLSVIRFEEIRIWGVPISARESIGSVFRFALHNGLPDTGDPEYQVMPAENSVAYLGLLGWYGITPIYDATTLPRRNHLLREPQYAQVHWESVSVEEQSLMWGQIATPNRPFLEVVLKNVECNIRDLERDAVWAWEFQPLFLGTGRMEGRSSVIDPVWSRGYTHGGVLTHCALAIGFTKRATGVNRNYWEFDLSSDSGDNRKVFVLSPSYAGRVEGRARVYTAILWKSASPSAAALPYSATFNTGYATPLVKIQLPSVASAGDVLVLYVYEGESARAVAQRVLTSGDITDGVVDMIDTDETLAYPFVNATAAYPYGPAISYDGRILVLDNCVWVSSRSDYPHFSVYPRTPDDGFRLLPSDPVERILMMDGQPIVIGSRQAYRVGFSNGKVGGGALIPYPLSIQSDLPSQSVPGRLEDYDSFVTREGLINERGLAYKLPEDWMAHPDLQSAWVVRTPYGTVLVRHYGARIVIAHPALTVKGYQWTTLERTSGSYPPLRDVQWVGGLVLMFESPVDDDGHVAIRVRQASSRAPSARYRLLNLVHTSGLRPRQIKCLGDWSGSGQMRVRLYGTDQTLIQELDLENPYELYTFRHGSRKIAAPYIEFLLGSDATWGGAFVRLGEGAMP